MGAGWMIWLRGPRAVQRELDRSDEQLAAARDALDDARQAVVDVQVLFGDTDAEVVNLDVVRRRRAGRTRVPVVAIAAGTAALIAAAVMVTDARMIPFLPGPDGDDSARSAEQAEIEMDPVVALSVRPSADAAEAAAAGTPQAGTAAAQVAPAAHPGAAGDPNAPGSDGPLSNLPLPELPDLPVPPLPQPPNLPVPPVPEPPDVTVPPLPPLPPVPPLPPIPGVLP